MMMMVAVIVMVIIGGDGGGDDGGGDSDGDHWCVMVVGMMMFTLNLVTLDPNITSLPI